MEKIDPKRLWKEKNRQQRINKKIEQENKLRNDRKIFHNQIDNQIESNKHEIKKLWIQTLPWYVFLPLIILIIILLDSYSVTTTIFTYICILACLYTYFSYDKKVKKSYLFNEYLTKKALKHYNFITRIGIILSIIVGVVFYKAHYWTAFSIAMVNLLVFFLLAYYFGLVFMSHEKE